MDIMRKGGKLELELNEDDARGLFAVLTGQPQAATPDQLQRGQTIYAWFFQNVQELATNFAQAAPVRAVGGVR